MPAKRLIYVRNRVAFGDWGSTLAPVSSADGLYADVDNIYSLTKDGQWIDKKEHKLSSRVGDKGYVIEAIAITSTPNLVHKDSYRDLPFQSIDAIVPVGAEVWCSIDGSHYYYIPAQKLNSELLPKRLAKWWRETNFLSAWVVNNGDHVRNPKFTAKEHSLNYGNDVLRITADVNWGGGRTLNELSKTTAKFMKREMGRQKTKLNRHLEPIGGSVIELLPYWQYSIPMLWVRFQIGKVDPTNGQGVMIYADKGCSFFYGPWCQRVRQKNARGHASMMFENPPSYNLRDWICGPLYMTAYDAHKSKRMDVATMGTPPAYFEPKGVKIIATGHPTIDNPDNLSIKFVSKKEADLRYDQDVKNIARNLSEGWSARIKSLVSKFMDSNQAAIPIEHTHAPFGCITAGHSRMFIRSDGDPTHESELCYTNRYGIAVSTALPTGFSNFKFGFDRSAVSEEDHESGVIVKDCTCHPCRARRSSVFYYLGMFYEGVSTDRKKIMKYAVTHPKFNPGPSYYD